VSISKLFVVRQNDNFKKALEKNDEDEMEEKELWQPCHACCLLLPQSSYAIANDPKRYIRSTKSRRT